MAQALVPITQEQALQRVDLAGAKWPQDLSPVHKTLLAELAVQYGLDPAFGELIIYQGKPYVGLDARFRKAHETGLLAGYETRPMTTEEKTLYRLDEKDVVFFASIYRKDWVVPAVEWGRVTEQEMKGANNQGPLARFPVEMAEKRALHRALRRAFALNLPGSDEAGAEDGSVVIEAGVRDVPQGVDKDTGELLSQARDGAAPPAQEEGPPRLANVGDLLNAALSRYRWAAPQVLTVLGLMSLDDITDLDDAWRRLSIHAAT